jgi:hypothetical protein
LRALLGEKIGDGTSTAQQELFPTCLHERQLPRYYVSLALDSRVRETLRQLVGIASRQVLPVCLAGPARSGWLRAGLGFTQQGLRKLSQKELTMSSKFGTERG